MKNRGQVTIFVIVGIIIVVVVGVAFYISSQRFQKGEEFGVLSVEKEALEVKQYITSCIDESLKTAVSQCSGNFPNGDPKCPDYEADIAERVKYGFCSCIPDCNDFSLFKNAEVSPRGDLSTEAKITEDKKKLAVTMEYPIQVKKGTQEQLIGTAESPFTAEYALEQSECAPIKIADNDYQECEAAEDKTIEVLGLILTYHTGDKVAIGGTCIAC